MPIPTFWPGKILVPLCLTIILPGTTNWPPYFFTPSHLPHLIAYNLVKTAIDFQKKNKKNIIKYSAGGLRDFSRTAASNEIMWRDIFFENKDNIIDSINVFIRNLKNFKKLIKNQKNIYSNWCHWRDL